MSRNAALNGKFLDSIVGVTVHRAAAGDDNQRTLEILVRPFARACELDFFTVLLALVAAESDLEFGLALGTRQEVAVDAARLRMIADTPGGCENDGAASWDERGVGEESVITGRYRWA